MNRSVPHCATINRIPSNSTPIKATALYFAALGALLVGLSGGTLGADEVASSLTIRSRSEEHT